MVLLRLRKILPHIRRSRSVGGVKMTHLKQLEDRKAAAKAVYMKARANYISDMSPENWLTLCEAKRNCMLLGVRI